MDLKSIMEYGFLWVQNPNGSWIFYGFNIDMDYGFFYEMDMDLGL